MPDTFNQYLYQPWLYNSSVPGPYDPTRERATAGGGSATSPDMINTGLGALAATNPYMALGTGLLGLVNTIAGYQGLNSSGNVPQYGATRELSNSYDRAEQMARQGLTPEEMAAANAGIARQNAAAYRNAVDMSGGNLSGAIRGAVNAQNLNATTDLTALDARQRRSNIQYADGLAREMQDIQNMNTTAALDQYNKRQQAYGQAGKAGLENIANWVNILAV